MTPAPVTHPTHAADRIPARDLRPGMTFTDDEFGFDRWATIDTIEFEESGAWDQDFTWTTFTDAVIATTANYPSRIRADRMVLVA